MEVPVTIKVVLGLVIIIVVYAIFKMLIILIFGTIAQKNEIKKLDEEIFEIKRYLFQNGWTIKYNYTKEFNFLEYPQIFHKEYSKGVISVAQKKRQRDLSIVYINTKDLNDKKNIKLDSVTIEKMNTLLRLEKKRDKIVLD